jgi:hypothetical protein
MPRQWFVYENGEQVGPIEETQLIARAAAGTLRPESLVLNDSMPQWRAAGEATDWVFGPVPSGHIPSAAPANAPAIVPPRLPSSATSPRPPNRSCSRLGFWMLSHRRVRGFV